MNLADLVYYPDSRAGISRQRRGKGFSYRAPDGTLICDKAERDRITALAVPPAYEDVWICPIPDGHLLATGRDERGRKQYRYHPDWTVMQAQTKFDRLVDFGHVLPRIRRRVRQDLRRAAGAHRFALAAAVKLIDRSALRVGNPAYTAENGSYGALTLRHKHISVSDDQIKLRFRAKGGKLVRRQIADRTLARVLNKIGDLPGADLLSWMDDAGDVHRLRSDTLNSYIGAAAGDAAVTAKSFRTWAGTVAAFEAAETGSPTIKKMAAAAAKVLHNTPAIARNSYIHPDVIALTQRDMPQIAATRRNDLKAVEQRLLEFLENC